MVYTWCHPSLHLPTSCHCVTSHVMITTTQPLPCGMFIHGPPFLTVGLGSLPYHLYPMAEEQPAVSWSLTCNWRLFPGEWFSETKALPGCKSINKRHCWSCWVEQWGYCRNPVICSVQWPTDRLTEKQELESICFQWGTFFYSFFQSSQLASGHLLHTGTGSLPPWRQNTKGRVDSLESSCCVYSSVTRRRVLWFALLILAKYFWNPQALHY